VARLCSAPMPNLDATCVAGLQAALNPRDQVFDRQLRDGRWSSTTDSETVTGTLICLLGLDRAGVTVEGLDPRAALDAVIVRLRQQRQHGAAGLALWVAAIVDGPPATEVLDRVGLPAQPAWLDRLTTMELGWLASGLAHEQSRSAARDGAPPPLVAAALEALVARQQPSGLLGHATPRGPLVDRLRSGVANFADQVYPLQALAFATLVGAAGAAQPAARLAAALADRQGPQGQWWWHYQAASGRVVSRYPVYSVHQHGMAPMALAALAHVYADDDRWLGAAASGRRWLWDNELGRSLVDDSLPTIWRSVERAESWPARVGRRVGYVVRQGADADARPRLRLNRETRPYEWAWQLYASAIERRLDPRRHIV
jgi:hypothetical protein